MNDLNKLLEQASEPEGLWALDRQALVAEGHKRVARRRWFVVVACAAAMAAITFLAATVPPAGQQNSREIADRPRSGDYAEVRIPAAEVERRCTISMNRLLGGDATWVAGAQDGHAVSAIGTGEAIETREGFQVVVRPEGTRTRLTADSEVCTIPQEPMLDELALPGGAEIPQPEDLEAIGEWCSRSTGYDLRDWSILAAVRASDDWLDAVAISDNGYVARCMFEPGSPGLLEIESSRYRDDEGMPTVPDGDTGPSDLDRYRVLYPMLVGDSQDGRVEVGGIGVIRGLPDGYRIAVSLPDGTPLATATTHGGGFAYSFEVDELPGNELHFEVVDAEGELAWEGSLSSPSGYGVDFGQSAFRSAQ